MKNTCEQLHWRLKLKQTFVFEFGVQVNCLHKEFRESPAFVLFYQKIKCSLFEWQQQSDQDVTTLRCFFKIWTDQGKVFPLQILIFIIFRCNCVKVSYGTFSVRGAWLWKNVWETCKMRETWKDCTCTRCLHIKYFLCKSF